MLKKALLENNHSEMFVGETPDRNPGLDFIKIAATMIIIFHHYQQVTESVFDTGINYSFGWFYFGRMVELFFLISGYVMYRYIPTILEGRITLKQWYWKRSARLLPLVAVSVVVYEVLLYIHGFLCDGGVCYTEKTIDIFGSIITMLGIQDGGVFQNPMINNPVWYISVLLIVYVVFYIATVLARRWSCAPNNLYIFIVLLGCGIETYQINLPFLNADTSRGYSCFFFGLLLADYVQKNGVSKRLAAVSLSTLVMSLYLMLFQRSMVQNSFHYLLSFVVFPAMILLTETNLSRKIFCHRFWSIWGQAAFNAYIWHAPMFYAMYIVTHLAGITPYYAQRKWMYLFYLLTQVVGFVSYFALERPLKRILGRRWAKITSTVS